MLKTLLFKIKLEDLIF